MSNRNRDYDLGPYEEEYRGFEIRDDETSRGPLILTLALGVLIVFGAVVWNTYRQGVRPQDGALPMVVAEAQPYKRVPDDRGGIQIEDLDRRLYDALDGSERQPEPTKVASATNGYLRGGPPQDLRPSGSAESSVTESPAPAQSETPPDMPVTGAPLPSATPPAAPAETETATAQPTLTLREEMPVQQASRFAFVSGGDYLVQISALRSEEAATEAWKRARRSNPDVFEGASMSIERADLGARGVFYRLRAGAFASRDTAADFCAALKSKGGDCIVVQDTA